jgi:hypothetical protein
VEESVRNVAILASVLCLLFGLGSDVVIADCQTTTVDLIAGQHTDVGEVVVTTDATNMYVTYRTTGGWKLCETHLHIAQTLAGIPQSRGGPVPGKFAYKKTHASATEFTYTVPLVRVHQDADGCVVIAAHAVVKLYRSWCRTRTETAWGKGSRFPCKNWAMYFQHCVSCDDRFPIEGFAFIGYEDKVAGDFDYNDFGMRMQVEERYGAGDVLTGLTMNFVSQFHLAQYLQDIHILRDFDPAATYTYTITRSTPAQGTEQPAGAYVGSGDLDVILYDSLYFAADVTVSIEVTMTSTVDLFDPGLVPPRPDLDPIFARYDPYMGVRDNGQFRHIADTQPFFGAPPDVPYILVVPIDGWTPGGEGVTITDVYPFFDDFYLTGTPANWYEL